MKPHTKQYGNAPHGLGRSKELDKHPEPAKEHQKHYSQMGSVDNKEMHSKSKSNMEALPSKQQMQKIHGDKRDTYKRQSHWASPKGHIDSVVGDGSKAGIVPGAYHPDHFSEKNHEYLHSRPPVKHAEELPTEIKRPDIDGDYDEGSGQGHIQSGFGLAKSKPMKDEKEPNNYMGQSKSSYKKYKEP